MYRSFTDTMSVSDATHVMMVALLNSALGDSDSGGLFRGSLFICCHLLSSH